MEALVQTILAEIPETVTTTILLEYVPRFLKEAEALTLPGGEKKEAVLRAMKLLVQLLKEQEKINDELANELVLFIDTTVHASVDLLVQAYNGTLRMPQTAEEVTQKANCILGCVGSILRMVRAGQKMQKPAEATAV
jgi:hypothetical protein